MAKDNDKKFMGRVEEALKHGNRFMEKLEKNQTKMISDIGSIKTNIEVQNNKFKDHVEVCEAKHTKTETYKQETDKKLGRDFKEINNLKDAVDIEQVSTKKSRSYITWIIGIAILLLMGYNTYRSNKSNSEVIILDKKTLIEMTKENGR
jgi:hypothetical protein